MIEIRFHGRGGQGTVVASEVLATAFFLQGQQVQAFPTFGVERRGAPVAAFLRVDSRPIWLRCQILEPDYVVVLDPTLMTTVDVASGLAPQGLLVINSDRGPEHFRSFFSGDRRIITVDAAGVAVRHGLGTSTHPIVNTAVLGAFSAATGLVPLEAVCQAIRRLIPGHAEANEEAASEAFSRIDRAALEVQ